METEVVLDLGVGKVRECFRLCVEFSLKVAALTPPHRFHITLLLCCRQYSGSLRPRRGWTSNSRRNSRNSRNTRRGRRRRRQQGRPRPLRNSAGRAVLQHAHLLLQQLQQRLQQLLQQRTPTAR